MCTRSLRRVTLYSRSSVERVQSIDLSRTLDSSPAKRHVGNYSVAPCVMRRVRGWCVRARVRVLSECNANTKSKFGGEIDRLAYRIPSSIANPFRETRSLLTFHVDVSLPLDRRHTAPSLSLLCEAWTLFSFLDSISILIRRRPYRPPSPSPTITAAIFNWNRRFRTINPISAILPRAQYGKPARGRKEGSSVMTCDGTNARARARPRGLKRAKRREPESQLNQR